MKKFFMSFVLVFASIVMLNAQSDCMSFFPNNEGTILVNERYDAKGTLLNTITYRILHSYGNFEEEDQDIQIGFTITNTQGDAIDHGVMVARCNNGIFYLNMRNSVMTDDVMDLLSSDTELVGDFLDYPNVFNEMNDPSSSGNPFGMNGGQFTVQSKTDKKDLIRTEVENRQYVKDEKITTPAGIFDAAKVTFDIKVTKDKQTTTYKGIEWYAVNAGIVRSETYDAQGNLLNYTLLTTLRNK